jgi:hypothetical protein
VIVSDPGTQEVKETLQILSAKRKKLGIFSNDRIIGLGLAMKAKRLSKKSWISWNSGDFRLLRVSGALAMTNVRMWCSAPALQ